MSSFTMEFKRGSVIRGQLRPNRRERTEMHTNQFRLFPNIQLEIFHYRVGFEPQVEYGKALLLKLKQAKTLPLGGYLFDGSSLFLTHKLNNQDEPIVLTVQNNDGQPIQITITLVGIVTRNEIQFSPILCIIMKHAMSALKLEMVGKRDYFDPRLFRSESILEIWNRADSKNDFERIVLGMTVLTKYNNKTYRISEVNFDMTPMSTFEGRNGEQICFRDYYRIKYNIHISNTGQPLLICKPKDRELRGGVHMIVLVPELCLATGCTDEMRSNFHLTRDVAEHTCVQQQPPPRIQNPEYNKRIQSTPDKMFATAVLDSWYFVYPRCCDREARSFRDCLLRTAAGMRFNIREPICVEIADDRTQTLNAQIEECCKNNPRLILTILASNNDDKYTYIKRKCYVMHGIASQVVLWKTISDPEKAMSVATEVTIQINEKLGGAQDSMHFRE